MLNQPLVSIIIPTYNRAPYLKEVLNSVAKQTYPHWECLVIDDGSIDDTEALVSSVISNDSRFHYYKRPENLPKGGNASRNYGYRLSKGDYVQWFDDDDLMLENYLEARLKRFSPEVDFVIGSGSKFYTSTENSTPIPLALQSYLFKDYVLWRLKVMTPSVLFRRAFLNSKDLFNEDLQRGQETELFSRLFFEVDPEQYVLLNDPLFFYRQHDLTKSSKNEAYLPSFKESETYVALENLKRSLTLNDPELIQFFYRVLLNFFFRGLEHKHTSNSKLILKQLLGRLFPKAPFTMLEFAATGTLFLVIGRGSHKIEMYFKNRNLMSHA